MSNHPILSVSKLVKTFGKKTAVNAVEFTIHEGEFIGLLGSNGAGKTTIIKAIVGLIKPTSGTVLYNNKNFEANLKESKKLIGVVPQNSNLDRDLTAYENLYLHTLLHNIPVKEREAKISTALDFAELSDYRDKQLKTFSGGMKRRLVIVRALIHDPKIIFLDEPTVGLDPQIRRNLWNLILKINQVKKTAILLTTHYIEEAEKLCNRVMVLDHGDIIMDNTPEKLKHGLGRFVLEIYNEEGITEKYFETQEAALTAQGQCQSESKIRDIALEDVIIQLTGRRVNA